MNVLHISPRLRPGGVNQLAADLACGLQLVVFKNAVVSPPNELVGRMTAGSVKHYTSHHVPLFSLFSEKKRLQRIIRTFKPDIILAYTTPAINLTWQICSAMPDENRPAIIGVYTTYPKHPGWVASMNRCSALVTISKHLRNELVQRAELTAEKNIWVIPYGVNEELCYPSYQPSAEWKEQWERNHKQGSGVLSICLPGAITSNHGLEQLPDILNRLEKIYVPAHVFIVGDTARANIAYMNKLLRLFKKRKIDQHITWLGLRTDLRDVLSSCDVAMTLARKPACHDRTILEALALGCPVVGYDHGYAGEVLDAFLPEGRVEPDNIDGIVDRLEQWHAYKPHMEAELPLHYRLSDTIRAIAELCTSLCRDSETQGYH